MFGLAWYWCLVIIYLGIGFVFYLILKIEDLIKGGLLFAKEDAKEEIILLPVIAFLWPLFLYLEIVD